MENASKALLMAGSVLIGILILSLGMYLYVSFSKRARDAQEMQENQQIVTFNEEYTVYDRNNLTIYDIITVVNKAKQNNRADNDGGYYVDGGDIPIIRVYLGGSELTAEEDSVLEQLLTEDINSIGSGNTELPLYMCTGIQMTNRRVSRIDFAKI